MKDGTKAKLQKQVFCIQTIKISSNEEEWLFLIQIRFNPLCPRWVYPYGSQSSWIL